MMTKTLDFTACEEKAARMDYHALSYAIHDCVQTIEAMDKLDRADGGNRAGYYRDECSVYRRAVAQRFDAELARNLR